ncbi:MAG: tRNA (adenosine(37)-N6)-threonylcarbamoyltransferase complex ATPase subunit type 1 TsaE [Duncaniella sp.]|nr:tRNA (adenosine(37)-N6)-threonylcarbamoyltransferase complex ATPase subunit type 1 TsaE [Duncaniella sp.]MDE5734951.1 tRNA (adenosine(37)-N6)-threonylcarbamoyltransferase complex ATPase subunit type 1 TsaE [Duncaniella sp.]
MSRTATIRIPSLDALPQAAAEFADLMSYATVFAFEGGMGAGKTTFINALARELGVPEEEATSSPTFAIVNEYRSDETAELIYHFDLYRLENLEQAFDIGIEDYLESGALCFIEWPDRIADILPDDTVTVTITEEPDGSRLLTLDNLPEEEEEDAAE